MARAVVALFAAVACAIYLPLREAPFVYEDLHLVTGDLTWNLPGRALALVTLGGSYRPEVAHLGNVVLHLANGLVFYQVAATLIPGATAVWAVLVFLLHPLHSEAVGYVAARTDLVMTLCVLLALWGVLRIDSWPRWVVAGLALAGAAMSKEIGLVGVPLLVLTLMCWRPEAVRLHAKWAGVFWIACGALAGSLYPRLMAWGTLNPNAGGSPYGFGEHVLLQFTAVWHLLALAVPSPLWLTGMSIDHDIVGLHPLWRLAAALLTVQALVVAAMAWRKGWTLALWALGWIAIGVLPRFVFQTNEFIAERHLYLLAPALSLCGGAGLAWLWETRSELSAPRVSEAR